LDNHYTSDIGIVIQKADLAQNLTNLHRDNCTVDEPGKTSLYLGF